MGGNLLTALRPEFVNRQTHLIQQHFIDGTEVAQGEVGTSEGRKQSEDEEPDGQNTAALHDASFRLGGGK